MNKSIISILILLCLTSCLTNKKTCDTKIVKQNYEVKLDTMNLFDISRNRNIPVAIFSPKAEKQIANQQVVIYSHGYRQNKEGGYLTHSNLTTLLASKGYFVICIQHELPTDSLIPKKGIPKIVRRSNWERGATNILFVLNEFKKTKPNLDYKRLTLIGCSNGGDMSMLFAQKYPNLLYKIISLDNRRCDFPRTSNPKIYSLRSSDQVADLGVLPTLEEQKKFGMKIIKLKNTIHNKMNDDANKKQRKEMNNYILDFLQE